MLTWVPAFVLVVLLGSAAVAEEPTAQALLAPPLQSPAVLAEEPTAQGWLPPLHSPTALAEDAVQQQAASEQARHPAGEASRPGDILGQLRYDFLYVVASPARMGLLGWGLTAGMAGSIYFAQAHRCSIQDWWRGNVRSGATDTISDIVRPLGNQFTSPLLAGAFLAGGLLSGRSHETETGVMLAESAVYTLALTSVGQFTFSEDRPCQGGMSHYVDGHIGHGISGHSSAAACLAGPLNRQYLQLKDSDTDLMTAAKIGGKVAVYGLPVLVGLSRVNGDSHYLWNVLAGWAIGYTVGELIPNAHEARKAGRSWWIAPVMDDKAVGAAFTMRF
jgi:hypothetical protein